MDAVALSVYRVLAPPRLIIARKQETMPGGHVAVTEIGLVSGRGYKFAQTTRGASRLLRLSESEAMARSMQL